MKKYSELAEDFCTNLINKYNDYEKTKTENIKHKIIRKISLAMSSACEDAVAILISDILECEKNGYYILIDVYMSYKGTNRKKGGQYRPDILILKKSGKGDNIKNEIVGIVEVKSQMGYCGILKPEDFEVKLDGLQGKISFSKKDYEKLRSNPDALSYYEELGLDDKRIIEFSINENAKPKIYVVNVLAQNHIDNVCGTIDNFRNLTVENSMVNFYSLFGPHDDEKAEYYSVDNNMIYENDKSKYEKDIVLSKRPLKTKKVVVEQCDRKNHGFEQFVKDIKKIKKYKI